MKPWSSALVVAVFAAAACSYAFAAAGGAYYAEAQAAQGKVLYAQNCARCHGAKLEGVNAPPLKGSSFKGTQTIGDIYTFTATQMPAGAPGSLSPRAYAAIMAYLLKENGHPAGAKPLTLSTARSIKEKI